MFEHQGGGPDLTNRICGTFPGDVRRGAVDRLEHRGKDPLRVEIRGRSDANRACDARTKIRQDVTKEIAANDDTEPFGRDDEASGKDIDVVLVGTDFRVIRGDRGKTLVPEGHRVVDAIGFGGRCYMIAPQPAR